MVCVINHYSWFAKLKQRSIYALLITFVVASILFLLPNAALDYDSGFTSSELEVKETVEENVTNTSYVNSDGIITDAFDMGYATIQRTRNHNQGQHLAVKTGLKQRQR